MPATWPHGRESNSPRYRVGNVIQLNTGKGKLRPGGQNQVCRNEHSCGTGTVGQTGEDPDMLLENSVSLCDGIKVPVNNLKR